MTPPARAPVHAGVVSSVLPGPGQEAPAASSSALGSGSGASSSDGSWRPTVLVDHVEAARLQAQLAAQGRLQGVYIVAVCR
jgi:hypothetical protein